MFVMLAHRGEEVRGNGVGPLQVPDVLSHAAAPRAQGALGERAAGVEDRSEPAASFSEFLNFCILTMKNKIDFLKVEQAEFAEDRKNRLYSL